MLSAYSADLGVINLEDCTALHYAAATGNANCCRFLAQRGGLREDSNHKLHGVNAVIAAFGVFEDLAKTQ